MVVASHAATQLINNATLNCVFKVAAVNRAGVGVFSNVSTNTGK